MSPLRTGVEQLKEIIKEAKFEGVLEKRNTKTNELTNEIKYKIKKIDSISAYFNVKIESSILTEQGIIYELKLNNEISKKKSINWDQVKKLMFGSLICLSNDFFLRNCLIGIICGRENLKEKNTIQVNLI
jgi:hypothetical protein